MVSYIARRLLWAVFVVLIVTMLTFLIFYVMPPGDPALRFAGRQPTPETIELVRDRFGLDKPWYQHYGIFLKHLATGDEWGWPGFGFSFDTRVPVRDELLARLPRTLILVAGAAILWAIAGITIGIVSAIRRGTWIDKLSMGFALFGVSAPVFWLGLVGL